MKIKYMHTIDDKPGHYIGNQICFAARSRPIKLKDSLTDIIKDQRQTKKWRKGKGFSNDSQYGHFRVRID